MFVLDTNVLSVMMSARPVERVASWLLKQRSDELFTAAVCQAEVLAGIAVLPSGHRRSELEVAARAMFADDFEGRVLAFDAEAATAYTALFAARRRAGRSTATIDLMIAAIAKVHGASVVTRNVDDFDESGLTVINPWNG